MTIFHLVLGANPETFTTLRQRVAVLHLSLALLFWEFSETNTHRVHDKNPATSVLALSFPPRLPKY